IPNSSTQPDQSLAQTAQLEIGIDAKIIQTSAATLTLPRHLCMKSMMTAATLPINSTTSDGCKCSSSGLDQPEDVLIRYGKLLAIKGAKTAKNNTINIHINPTTAPVLPNRR